MGREWTGARFAGMHPQRARVRWFVHFPAWSVIQMCFCAGSYTDTLHNTHGLSLFTTPSVPEQDDCSTLTCCSKCRAGNARLFFIAVICVFASRVLRSWWILRVRCSSSGLSARKLNRITGIIVNVGVYRFIPPRNCCETQETMCLALTWWTSDLRV